MEGIEDVEEVFLVVISSLGPLVKPIKIRIAA